MIVDWGNMTANEKVRLTERGLESAKAEVRYWQNRVDEAKRQQECGEHTALAGGGGQ